MTGPDHAELARLLSSLMRIIHELSSNDVRVLMEVDEHMRNDGLTKVDLDRLRQMSASLNGHR